MYVLLLNSSHFQIVRLIHYGFHLFVFSHHLKIEQYFLFYVLRFFLLKHQTHQNYLSEYVNYEVTDTRVGQNENYDKLTMEVATDGSMTPEEAMALASKILIEHFNVIADLNSISNIDGIMQEKKVDTMTKKLETPIEEVEFSVRAYNCLKRAGIHTIQDLVDKKEVEVML